MPYKNLEDLPEEVKKLPTKAQKVFMSAFNSAYKEYDGDEEKAFAVAWSAVKKEGYDKVKKTKELKKSNKVQVHGNLCKIDLDNQIVYGFATGGDLIDSQGEIVEWSATQEALDEYREFKKKLVVNQMHQPNTDAGYVPVCISDNQLKRAWFGAKITDPEAWEKVQKREYNGFSIEGTNVEREDKFHPDLGKIVSHVKKYNLTKVSLVDSGAYPDSNFVLYKSEDVPKELINEVNKMVKEVKKGKDPKSEASDLEDKAKVEKSEEVKEEVEEAGKESEEVNKKEVVAEEKEEVEEPSEEEAKDEEVEKKAEVEKSEASEEMVSIKKSEYEELKKNADFSKAQEKFLDLRIEKSIPTMLF